MYNSKEPTNSELPSTAKLVKSTVLAAVIAVVLLLTVVLPAEYGIDPTGAGSVLGLKKMGEIKASLEAEIIADESRVAKPATNDQKLVNDSQKSSDSSATQHSSKGIKKESMKVVLAPNQGAEIKAIMKKGDKLEYTWNSDGGKTNFDVHGDSKQLKIRYHPYEKGSLKNKTGSITAAFDGSHGWFWRNRTGKRLTVSLEVSGEFEELKRVQ